MASGRGSRKKTANKSRGKPAPKRAQATKKPSAKKRALKTGAPEPSRLQVAPALHQPRRGPPPSGFPAPDATPPMEAASLSCAGATPPPVRARPALPTEGVDPDATPPAAPTQPVFLPPPGATPSRLSEAPPALPPPASEVQVPDATPPMVGVADQVDAHATPPTRRDEEANRGIAPAISDLEEAARSAVALSRSGDELEVSFTAWEGLRIEQRRALGAIDAELQRIEAQEALLSRSVVEGHQESDSIAARVEMTLSMVRAELLRARAQAELAATQASETIRAELSARVGRRARAINPRVRVSARRLPGGRRILHLERPSPDDAVALLYVFCGRIPSRFDYLSDDSTGDLQRAPELFFPEEGGDDDTRPPADVLLERLHALPAVWPVKAILPLFAERLLVLWRARGAVLEAELGDGPVFRNLLTEHEAERIIGQLQGLEQEGRLRIELFRG